MNSSEDIRSISYIRANAAEVIDQVNETHRPIYITQNGEAKAVVLDPGSYERMKKALGLLRILAQSERDVAEGRVIAQDNLFDSMDREYDRRNC